MKNIFRAFLFIIFFLSQAIHAKPGLLFNVTSELPLAAINFNLCLDGYGPLSCQNFTFDTGRLKIKTTPPNHTYFAAGIKINTPGFYPINCTPIPNGYCLFTVSDTVPAIINILTLSTLSASVQNMVLKALGNTRIITITNTGSYTATNVHYTVTPALSGGTISPATCGNIPPGGQCVLSIEPGNADTTATVLNIKGDDTNSVNVNLYTLALNSFWQGGFVFYIDDSTPPNTSISGEVIFESSELGTAVPWSNITFESILGATSLRDGKQNTIAIVASQGPGNYPAYLCSIYTGGGADNWYSPAICQLVAPDTTLASCPTTVPPTPTAATIDYPNASNYWSSTQFDANNAWILATGFPDVSQSADKSTTVGGVCAHVFVPLP